MERSCKNCGRSYYEDFGPYYTTIKRMCERWECRSYEGKTDEEIATECERYVDEEEPYIPSATHGDYSPSNPAGAPGMSWRDFI